MGEKKRLINTSLLHKLCVRPIRLSDFEAFKELAFSAQSGLTSLPKDDDLLLKKLTHSIDCFRQDVSKPGGEIYIFVMENTQTNEIIGTCTIYSLIGFPEPFYTFDIHAIEKKSNLVGTDKTVKVLKINTVKNGPTEIGGLYLKPEYRQSGVGRFLSLSRFLFMAIHRQRFNAKVIAEMRGVIDESGKSPFWSHVGKTFFDMSFLDADLMSVRNKQFIADLVPQYPIYVDLLPQEVQGVIGKPHQNTIPALKLLESEGFVFSKSVDIFDGGPKVAAPIDEVRTVAGTFEARIEAAPSTVKEGALFMLSNDEVEDFKVVCAYLEPGKERAVNVQKQAMTMLDKAIGDAIQCAALYKERDLGRFASWFTMRKTTSSMKT